MPLPARAASPGPAPLAHADKADALGGRGIRGVHGVPLQQPRKVLLEVFVLRAADGLGYGVVEGMLCVHYFTVLIGLNPQDGPHTYTHSYTPSPIHLVFRPREDDGLRLRPLLRLIGAQERRQLRHQPIIIRVCLLV